MSLHVPDPNRFADGLDAVSVRARIDLEQSELDFLRGQLQRAEDELGKAKTNFHQNEVVYLQLKNVRDDAQTLVDRLHQKCNTQVVAVEQQRSLLHPMRKTPPEILNRIFFMCLPTTDDCDNIPRDSPIFLLRARQPFFLAAVCRRWRAASIGGPLAWSHLEFPFDLITGDTRISPWLRYIHTFTTRSSVIPVALALHRIRPPKLRDHEIVKKIVTELLPRCSSISLRVSDLQEKDPLLPILTGFAPLLRQVQLHSATRVRERLVMFPASSLLESFTSKHIQALSSTAISGLNTIALTRAKWRDLRAIVISAPELQTIDLAFYDGSNDSTHTSVSAQNVRHLTLETSAKTSILSLATSLATPNVETLHLVGDGGTQHVIYLAKVVDMCSRLRHLAIWTLSALEIDTFCDTLIQLPHLGLLEVENSLFTKDDLERFFGILSPQDDGNTWLCRSLVEIHLHGVPATFAEDCDFDGVISTISSRIAASCNTRIRDRPKLLTKICFESSEKGDRSLAHVNNQIDGLILAASAK